jgi:hypothetical protein
MQEINMTDQIVIDRFHKLPRNAQYCLLHATRRWLSFGPEGQNNIVYVANPVENKPTLTNSWLGFGQEKFYRDALEYDLVKPVSTGIDSRSDQWWQLTPSGEEYVKSLLRDDYLVSKIRQDTSLGSEFQIWPDY